MLVSKLYAILNTESHAEPLLFLEKLLHARISLIQIRAKNMSDLELLELTAHTLLLRNSLSKNTKIIINDRVDICKEAGADGVHLGQEDTSLASARAILGETATIGLSTHNLEQIKSAPQNLLSYLALGPIFESSTKSGHAPCVGLATLKEARTLINLPLVAIGGITLENANYVLAAGADYIAVISDLKRFIY